MQEYVAIAKVAHQTVYPTPIRFRNGDSVKVGRRDDEFPGWIWTTIESGDSGWAPAILLQVADESALAVSDYDSTELATKAGEKLVIRDEISGWAWATNQRGDAGWVPVSGLQQM